MKPLLVLLSAMGLGCGEAAFGLAAETTATLPLSGTNWWIHDADGQGGQQGMPEADVPASGWIPATVPGNIQADLDSLFGLPANILVSDAHGQSQAQTTIQTPLRAGTNHLEAFLSLSDPALWWPAGQGAQPIYGLAVDVRRADTSEPLDRWTTRFGIREIRWEQNPGTPADFINPLKLVVNDGLYGNAHSRIGGVPNASFQIDLGQVADIGRFRLGRDRTGGFPAGTPTKWSSSRVQTCCSRWAATTPCAASSKGMARRPPWSGNARWN